MATGTLFGGRLYAGMLWDGALWAWGISGVGGPPRIEDVHGLLRRRSCDKR